MAGTDSPEHKKARTDDGGADKWKLKPHKSIEPPTKESPLLVVVLDGWGVAPNADDNAISRAGVQISAPVTHVAAAAMRGPDCDSASAPCRTADKQNSNTDATLAAANRR